ncbi:MAG: cation diffusion facilitator family transporter [Deltaproteobacteria bacterium]|nr:cation diffusion facilitator family transporter [Deltaproteobacteria bacterium]
MEHTHHHCNHPPALLGSDDHGETRLAIALVVTCLYMVVEIAGGLLFNSLALLADAGHMLSDAMALGLSWVAIRIGRRSPNDRLTFGFTRSEILTALFNGLLLWAIVALIFYEAIHRFFKPEPVQGLGMFLVATVGLILNLAMAGLLFGRRKESLNIRGAFLHVLSDALGSIGALAAGILIIYTNIYWIDPLVSVLIGVLILMSSWGLLKESVHVLMEGVPKGLDVSDIESVLVGIDGVCCVYDLHVWSLSSLQTNLSAHVVLAETVRDPNEILIEMKSVLNSKFSIRHATIQIEISHEMRSESDRRFCRVGTGCDANNAN